MKNPYQQIILKGARFDPEELIRVAKLVLSSNASELWEKTMYRFILEWISDAPNIQLKTSGSTGQPQIIQIEKEKLVKSALLTGDFFNLQKKDKALLCLPVDFIAGKMMIVRAFVLGLDLIPVNPSSNPLVNIDETFDFAAMTPMQVQSILDVEGGHKKLNRIKTLIVGGGEISSLLLSEIRQLKNNTYHTYGMTETLTHVAVRRLNGKGFSHEFEALSGIKFMMDDRNCLVVKAKHLGEKAIVTNDIVELITDKKFKYIGRADNVINSGGLKFSPEQIEKKLDPFIETRFIVAGIPDEKLGQKIILVIESDKPDQYNLDDIVKKAGLSAYEKPKIIFTLPYFPKTGTGKIMRQKTIELLLSSF